MYDVVIIGAGPAGLTAALYCGRSKLSVKVLDKAQAGGQLNLTDEIENYPGVLRIKSHALVDVMLKQARELSDVQIDEFCSVDSLEQADKHFVVRGKSTINEKEFCFESKVLIVATGANPKKLNVPGEDIFAGKGVSYCAVCDAPLFRNKEVVVVGGGNTALEEALYLAKFAHKVTLIHRRDSFRGGQLLQERARHNPKINFALSSVVAEIAGDKVVQKVLLKNVQTEKITELPCSGAFIFAGYQPNTECVKKLLKVDGESYILADESTKTTIPGIFACGDCRKRPLRQVVTACAEGAVAACGAEHYISQL